MDLPQSVVTLEDRLKLQELISEVALILENLPSDEVDGQIENALRRIVEFLGIDRCSFGEYTEDRKAFYVTHSYAVSGVEPVARLLLIELMPWLAAKARGGEIVKIETPADLPAEAVVEKAHWDHTGQKSALAIPIPVGGSILCGIGLGSFRNCRSWPDHLVQQLKLVGEIFAHAVYRKRAEEKIKNQLAKLENQFQFEMLISTLSARFVNIPRDQVDREIELSLGQLLRFFQIDRLALLKVSQDKKIATVTHSENAEGIPSVSTTINYAEHFPWHTKKILAREVVSIHIKDLPPEAELDRKSAEAIGSRSNLVIPLIVNDSVDYVLAANAVKSERTWENELIPRIRLLGEIFIHALIRKQAEDELAKSYDEIKVLKNRLEAEAEYLRSEIKVAYHYEEIVGESKAIREVLSQLEQVAGTNSSVLLLGETGTGKELIARAIHNLSPRKNRAMVKISCASLPSTLIESELFGREKGAYTGALSRQIGRFEIADGSTIFLDEIGELSLDLQIKLLRVLQEGEFERLGSSRTMKVDVRIIAATNRNLAEAVRKGVFREDLYYRLNVFPIRVPPLRERPKDIPLLVTAFLNEFRQKMGKNIDSIPKQTMEALMRYHWPGNIRELRNLVEHGVIISTGKVLRVQLPQETPGALAARVTLDEAEAHHITQALEMTNWVIKGPNGAARTLGLKPSTLYNKMKRLGIPTARTRMNDRI